MSTAARPIGLEYCDECPPPQLQHDPTMAALISRYGRATLRAREPFTVVARSIIAQQISTKAADALRAKIGAELGFDPKVFATLPVEKLRRHGLPRHKAECLVAIARRAATGEFASIQDLPDDAVIRLLRRTKGIGPWTAQMFLIFALARADIWPTSDAGLKTACRRLFNAEAPVELEKVGQRFAPYRSVATLYLWKSLENTNANRLFTSM